MSSLLCKEILLRRWRCGKTELKIRQDEFEPGIFLNTAQQLFEVHVFDYNNADNGVGMEQLQEALWANSKVVKICGPSGTAKTTLVHRFISWTPQRNRDSSIRDAPPTSELHACALDTGAAWTLQRVSLQSGFDEEVSHASCLTCSNSCVVDELSRFQPCEFDCIVQLWTLGERTTGLFLVGNRWATSKFWRASSVAQQYMEMFTQM